MGSISDKLEYLLDTKEQLKSALIDKSIDIDDNTTFRNFAIKTTEDTGLVNTSDATATAEDMTSGITSYVNGQKLTGAINIVDMITDTDPDNFMIQPNFMGMPLCLISGKVNPQTATGRAIVTNNTNLDAVVNHSVLANGIGLYPNILKNGSTVLGVKGSVIELNGQTKNITPSLNPQIIEPDEGYNGITVVNIDAVTSNIDPNISAENIKNGVTILNITGTLDGGIDTSDADAKPLDIKSGNTAYVNGQKLVGTLPVLTYPVNPYNAKDWDYQFQASTQNLKRVTRDGINYILGGHQIVNGVDSWMFEGNSKMKMGFTESNIAQLAGLTPQILAKGQTVLGVEGTLEPYSGDGWLVPPGLRFNGEGTLDVSSFVFSIRPDISNMFSNCTRLTQLLGLEDWDTSNISNMRYLFSNCRNLTELDTSNWNTSNARDMTCMFFRCTNLTTLNVSNWNISNANISYMFSGCSNLVNIDVSNWNTSNVTTIAGTFNSCSNLVNIDVSNWNVSNVTTIAQAFSLCSNLVNIDVSNWNTVKIINMSSLFAYCYNLTDIDISNWNLDSTTNIADMFAYTNLSSVAGLPNNYMFNNMDLCGMFSFCNNLTNIDVSNWRFSNCNIRGLFRSCKNLQNIDISNWTFNQVQVDISDMFAYCTNLVDVDVSNWDASNITSMAMSFCYCNNLSDASIDSIINMCLNANIGYKDLRTTSTGSPFAGTNITNARYQNRWSELTAAGWIY